MAIHKKYKKKKIVKALMQWNLNMTCARASAFNVESAFISDSLSRIAANGNDPSCLSFFIRAGNAKALRICIDRRAERCTNKLAGLLDGWGRKKRCWRRWTAEGGRWSWHTHGNERTGKSLEQHGRQQSGNVAFTSLLVALEGLDVWTDNLAVTQHTAEWAMR